jgi:hypothetical protein
MGCWNAEAAVFVLRIRIASHLARGPGSRSWAALSGRAQSTYHWWLSMELNLIHIELVGTNYTCLDPRLASTMEHGAPSANHVWPTSTAFVTPTSPCAPLISRSPPLSYSLTLAAACSCNRSWLQS